MNPGPRETVLDRFRLNGKVALVTGASSGLGVHIAVALAEAGCDVVVGARRDVGTTVAIVQETGRRALGVAVDVRDPVRCARMVESAIDAFGRVDVLVNNAGIGTAVPALTETSEQFAGVVDVNLCGAYWMAQACARVMGPGSSIVNVGSVLGITTAGLPQAAYSASKAGLMGLTRDLAQQWTRRRGIRVNVVVPGFFPSEMTDQYPPGYLESMASRILAGRTGDPRELAAAVVFLASDASGYVTGQSLVVDGGMSIA